LVGDGKRNAVWRPHLMHVACQGWVGMDEDGDAIMSAIHVPTINSTMPRALKQSVPGVSGHSAKIRNFFFSSFSPVAHFSHNPTSCACTKGPLVPLPSLKTMARRPFEAREFASSTRSLSLPRALASLAARHCSPVAG